MERGVQQMGRYAAAAAMLALPVFLLLSSVRMLGELEETRNVYLRNRAATIAARLENLHPAQLGEDLFGLIAAEEPALADLVVYDSPGHSPENDVVRKLWRGEILFQSEQFTRDGEKIFRIYTPFHLGQSLRIARIDLASDAADFLVAHSRHHLLLSLLASLALVLFTVYFLWSERRAAALARRQLELEHLAHLGQMSAVLAHEIRNPLGAIKGFVQLALETAGRGVRTLLGPVLDETARLEKLVNDLLLYGRPRVPEIRSVDWREIAGQLEAHAAGAIGARPIHFRAEGPTAEIRTDPELLVHVLLNLVRNSIEALHDESGGEVHLQLSAQLNRGYSIAVEDNGPGIPENVRARLFEPFLTTKSNGTGLGLSIARKLTNALGGRLEIRAREPRGTRAELVFDD